MSVRDAIVLGDGVVARLATEMRARGLPNRAFLIADANVMAIHGDAITAILDADGIQVQRREVPPGETSKSFAVATDLYAWLAAGRAERGEPLVALGGGVTGDLVGFVAATYLRGLPLVQVPTTLLAQIDSSIGGKVAVDLPAGKNLVGAFYPALLTLVDPRLLATLPRAQLVADYAEVIKTAIIFDAAMFHQLEASADRMNDPALLADLVERCITWKAKVVDEDPFDRGVRTILNYGHTIGHAIESVAGYGAYRHGEAVAIGMAGAAAIAVRSGRCDPSVETRQNALLARVGLPLRYAAESPEAILEAMRLDKKVRAGRVKWVLPTRVGAAEFGLDVDTALVREVLHGLRAA